MLGDFADRGAKHILQPEINSQFGETRKTIDSRISFVFPERAT